MDNIKCRRGLAETYPAGLCQIIMVKRIRNMACVLIRELEYKLPIRVSGLDVGQKSHRNGLQPGDEKKCSQRQ